MTFPYKILFDIDRAKPLCFYYQSQTLGFVIIDMSVVCVNRFMTV